MTSDAYAPLIIVFHAWYSNLGPLTSTLVSLPTQLPLNITNSTYFTELLHQSADHDKNEGYRQFILRLCIIQKRNHLARGFAALLTAHFQFNRYKIANTNFNGDTKKVFMGETVWIGDLTRGAFNRNRSLFMRLPSGNHTRK